MQAQRAAMALAESGASRSARAPAHRPARPGDSLGSRGAQPVGTRPGHGQTGGGDGHRRPRPAADRAPRGHARGHDGPRATAGLRAGRPGVGRAPLAAGPPGCRQAPPVRPRGAAASRAERSVAGRRSARRRRRSALLPHQPPRERSRTAGGAGPPDLPPASAERAEARTTALARRHRRRPGRTLALRNATVGWGTWFGNRRMGLRYRWFRLRTTSSYRGAPQL